MWKQHTVAVSGDLKVNELGQSWISNEQVVQVRTDDALNLAPVRQLPRAVLRAHDTKPHYTTPIHFITESNDNLLLSTTLNQA